MNETKVVVFKLNNQMCGADTSQVQEIKRYQDITKIPKLPKFIEGVISLRGGVVPVINLNRRFELGDTEIDKKTKIIITNIDGKPVGFIVNDVTEIMNLSEEDNDYPPDVIRTDTNSYLKSIGKKGDMLISILDLGKILSDGEVKKLSKIEK